MRIERSLQPEFLSNTYLVTEGDSAFFVDAGGPVGPLLDLGAPITHVLVTHRHGDHVAELGEVLERHPDAAVLAHPEEEVLGRTGTIGDGDVVRIGDLEVRAIHTPGHTSGMLAFHVGDELFTGDTLFRGSVGGVRAPGSTSYEDLRRSIMDHLLALPPHTRVHPGHTDPTTVGEELEHNAFVRVWRGLDPEGDEPCRALGEPATLVLWAPDYDGGNKAWVRWPDGRDDIVPGSRVERG